MVSIVTSEENNTSTNLCLCGCGNICKAKYIHGHNRKGKRKHAYSLILCKCGCGEMINNRHTKFGYLISYIKGHHKKGQDYSGSKSPSWKGGRYLASDGYYLIHKPDHSFADSKGYVKEHRLIYEEYYKCCLLPYTIIHHKNGVRTDNKIENLQPLFHNQHISLHLAGKFKIDMSDRQCSICNYKDTRSWYTYENSLICNRCYMKIYMTNYRRINRYDQ